MPRVKTKYGKYCTFYLSSEAIAKLIKMSSGNKSAYVQALILKDYKAPENNLEEFKEKESLSEEELNILQAENDGLEIERDRQNFREAKGADNGTL